MGAYQRRDRRNEWWIEFVHRGRRVRRRSPIQHGRGAEAYERKLRNELDTGTEASVGVPIVRPPRFAEYAERWMRDYVRPQNRRSGTRDKSFVLRLHLVPKLGALRLDEITTAEVDSLIATLKRRGLKNKTINNVLTVLRRALSVATEWKLLRAGPFIRRLEPEDPSWRYLSEQESNALLAATTPGFWRMLVVFILHTGVRFSEAAALEWTQIHAEEERPFVDICRGGSRGFPGPTKSGRTRKIPLSPELVAMLRSFPRKHRLVFPQSKGREMMDPASEGKYLDKFCDVARIERCGWHVLRHTFGSRMAALGVPMPVLQKLMGHKNIKTTMRYVHVDDATALAFAPAIEQALPLPWSRVSTSPHQSPNQSPARLSLTANAGRN